MPMSWGSWQQGCSVTNLQGTLSLAHIARETAPAPGLVLVSRLLSSSISLSSSESCRLIGAGVGREAVVVMVGLVVSRIINDVR